MQHKLPAVPSCLVLDVRLPGLSGFELHAELSQSNIRIPIVFITAHGDIPMSVRAMKGGAIDFLTKPFRDQEMLDAVTAAISRDRARLDAESARLDIQKLFDSLTPREHEVMALVTSGLMNKQIAAEVGLSEITVKIYRGHVMKKMKAKSLADLVKIAECARYQPGKAPVALYHIYVCLSYAATLSHFTGWRRLIAFLQCTRMDQSIARRAGHFNHRR